MKCCETSRKRVMMSRNKERVHAASTQRSVRHMQAPDITPLQVWLIKCSCLQRQ